jgi:hypothetical protein
LELGLDLTIYPERLTVPEWESALDIYRAYAPPQAWKRYLASPDRGFRELATRNSVRPPLSDAAAFPFLSGIRDRTVRGWRTEFRVWDGELSHSWSACFYRLAHKPGEPEYAFYRFLFPWDTAPALVLNMARELGEKIDYLSGHGGYCFLYDPYFKGAAFTHIYGLAKRYLAVDVEDLNSTIKHMHAGLKAISWLTLMGGKFLADPRLAARRRALETIEGASSQACGAGVLLQLGDRPILGDVQRPEPELASYHRTGTLLDPAMLTEITEFEGPFAAERSTLAWIHRFAEPERWTLG